MEIIRKWVGAALCIALLFAVFYLGRITHPEVIVESSTTTVSIDTTRRHNIAPTLVVPFGSIEVMVPTVPNLLTAIEVREVGTKELPVNSGSDSVKVSLPLYEYHFKEDSLYSIRGVGAYFELLDVEILHRNTSTTQTLRYKPNLWSVQASAGAMYYPAQRIFTSYALAELVYSNSPLALSLGVGVNHLGHTMLSGKASLTLFDL